MTGAIGAEAADEIERLQAALHFNGLRPDEAEALAIANSTEYGLGAGLWTRNLQRAHLMAREIKSGMVWINCYKRVNPGSPFGGVGQSGYGREKGQEGIAAYLSTKSICVKV